MLNCPVFVVVLFCGYPSPRHSLKSFLKDLLLLQCLLHLEKCIMLSCTRSSAVALYMCLLSLQWHASSSSVTWCWGLCAARHPKVCSAAVPYFRCKVRPPIACSAHLRHSDSAGGHVRYRLGGCCSAGFVLARAWRGQTQRDSYLLLSGRSHCGASNVDSWV